MWLGDEQAGKGMSEVLKGSDYILWVLELLWFPPAFFFSVEILLR